MMISPWDEGTRLYEYALDVRSGIHETIASNLANEETPGYKARIIPFRETLSALLSGQGEVVPARTNPRHMALHEPGETFFVTPSSSMKEPAWMTIPLIWKKK